MKFYYSFLLISFFAFQVAAQQPPMAPPAIQAGIGNISNAQLSSVSNEKSFTNCTSDTIRYVRNGKATDFLAITMNVPSEFAGYAQYYEAPQQILVSGMVFYAGVNSVNVGDTAIVRCRIYEANPDSTIGAILTEKNITVYNNYFPSNIDQMKYVVDFDSIATCNQAYYASIWTETTQSLGIITDDYNAGDGQGEELGYWFWTGDNTWYPSGQFFTWDVDYLLEPIVDYTLSDTLMLSANSLCIPDNVCALHDWSPIFESRMYSVDAFAGQPELANSFDWDDGTVTTGTDSCHTYTAGANYGVTYTATLSGWTSSCSVSSVDSVWVGEVPTASYTTQSTLLTTDFTNGSSGDPSSFMWDFGDGNSSSIDSPSHTYASPGSYTICLIASNFCGTDTSCAINDVFCPNPTADFTSTVNSSTVNFTDASTGNTISAWSWDFGDGNTSTVQNPSHTYSADGDYIVCLSITDDCGSMTLCDTVTISTLSIDELTAENGFTIFPNPSSGTIAVAIKSVISDNTLFTVKDAAGRIVYAESLLQPTTYVDLSTLSNGVYYVNLSTDGRLFVQPLVITKGNL